VRPEHIAALLRPFAQPKVLNSPLFKVRCTGRNIANPNAVKVVTAADGRALYSPAPPSPSTATQPGPVPAWYWKHIGLYGSYQVPLNRFPPRAAEPRWNAPTPHSCVPGERPVELVEPTKDNDTIGVDTEPICAGSKPSSSVSSHYSSRNALNKSQF